jgi:hypothetical protein
MIQTRNNHWWEGTISFSYNLKKVAAVLIALALVALAGFGLYWLAIGVWKLLGLTWTGLCWVGTGIWSIKFWLLGLVALLLAIWGLTKVNWAKFKPKEKLEGDTSKRKWWPFALVALVLIILGALLFRGCDKDKDVVIKESAEVVSAETFNAAFDWVVTSRAYLDGVQSEASRTDRALVGLKFVNGEAVTGKTFVGKTYEQAVEIIAQDWRELVVNNLNGQKLSEQQLVVVTLFAMRNGQYGFLKSDFLREVQAGNLDEAANFMWIHKATGERRTLKEEAQKYLWVLKNLWDGNLSVNELINYPMFSYKRLNMTQMYDKDGNCLFKSEYRDVLEKGDFQTPKEALEL